MKLTTLIPWTLLMTCSFNASSVNPPVMGWSSRLCFGLDINEDIIKNQTEAIVANGLDSVGYKYINIDDGYWNGRDKDGNLMLNTRLFPGGMRALTDFIHAKGLKAGIYSDAGRNSCGSRNKQKWGIGVGLAGYEAADCKLYFKDWNFDYIKVDFCGGQRMGLDEKRQYTKIARAIRNCGKNDIIYNISRWAYPGVWVSDIADSWRTSGDISSSWESLKNIILDNLYIQAYTGNGHYNDMDVLVIGRGLSPDEEKTQMAYWCIASSPLIIGNDVTKLPENSLKLLKNEHLLAMNQDSLGLGSPVIQRDGEVYVVAKDMGKVMNSKRALVVMNLSENTQTIDVDLTRAGFSGTVSVFDCFTKERLPGSIKGSFSVEIPPHASKAFHITGQRIEKSIYQAEEAFLPAYQELGKEDSPSFGHDETADGGIYVTKLGNSKENILMWKNVYSQHGGMYNIAIRYASDTPAEMIVGVNGRPVKKFNNLSSRGLAGRWKTISMRVPLKHGNNTIVIYNHQGNLPDIDCMQISK